MTKRFIFFSGGNDSAYLAEDAARNTADDLTLGRFILKWPNTGPGVPSKFAAHNKASCMVAVKIADWITANIRKVTYVEVPLTLETGTAPDFESSIWAGKQAALGAYDIFVSGWNAEFTYPGEGRFYRPRAFKSVFDYLSGGKGQLIFPIENKTKIDTLPLMSPALRALAITCFSPEISGDQIWQCGKCVMCRRLDLINVGLAAGTPKDAILAALKAEILANPAPGNRRRPDKIRWPDFAYWPIIEKAFQ
jgi:hypothetical protein